MHFPESFSQSYCVSLGEHRGSGGNKTHCFPRGQSVSVSLYLPTQNYQKLRRNRLLYAGWLIKFPRFQGARPDHVRVESSCCFPRELVSFVRPRELVCFVRPRELVSFDPRHVTRFPPIGKHISILSSRQSSH